MLNNLLALFSDLAVQTVSCWGEGHFIFAYVPMSLINSQMFVYLITRAGWFVVLMLFKNVTPQKL